MAQLLSRLNVKSLFFISWDPRQLRRHLQGSALNLTHEKGPQVYIMECPQAGCLTGDRSLTPGEQHASS